MVYGHQQWCAGGLRECDETELDFLYTSVVEVKKAEAEASKKAAEDAKKNAQPGRTTTARRRR